MTQELKNKKLAALKAELDEVMLVMPNTFAEVDRQNQVAFLISRDIELLENPLGYKENENHWEGHQLTLK